jgi:hypothetical protein
MSVAVADGRSASNDAASMLFLFFIGAMELESSEWASSGPEARE